MVVYHYADFFSYRGSLLARGCDYMAPRLVLVHGVGKPRRQAVDRERWISALADGARRAGHSLAAERLIAGELAEIVFAYYGDLFAAARRQGAEGIELTQQEAELLHALLTEITEAQCDAHPNDDGQPGAALASARAQLRLGATGTAQGAGDLVRQSINAATTLLGARPWDRAGQWVGGKFLVADLAQAARYLSRGNRTRPAKRSTRGSGPRWPRGSVPVRPWSSRTRSAPSSLSRRCTSQEPACHSS